MGLHKCTSPGLSICHWKFPYCDSGASFIWVCIDYILGICTIFARAAKFCIESLSCFLGVKSVHLPSTRGQSLPGITNICHSRTFIFGCISHDLAYSAFSDVTVPLEYLLKEEYA
ncbi:hypothetical protein KC19_1G315500 [Ceratodon purpureus]|uniref:Uncharacterized protein n=1 Tax=Ceratodon purpureus TaxID=3225 RepID=A0A8T0JEG2_CERPU|nr:hypothetical protein KC19_1G315500 [Ceratodon purpureus]